MVVIYSTTGLKEESVRSCRGLAQCVRDRPGLGLYVLRMIVGLGMKGIANLLMGQAMTKGGVRL